MKKNENKKEKEIKKINEAKESTQNNSKEKEKPDIVLIVLYIILFIILAFMIFTKIKNRNLLRNDDKLAVELHEYFTASTLEACGGLFNYDSKKVTYDDIENSSKVCIAYHKSDLKNAEKLTYKAKEIDSTCNVDGLIFKTDEGSKTCQVTKIKREVIDNTYKKIFNKDIEDNETFKYDGYHVCYLKDDNYYCGLSEYYTIRLGREISVYRSVDKVTKIEDTITIYDYFAKVLDDKECYKDYVNLNINSICLSLTKIKSS